jgi:quinol-cytochrome oxidoreductase complex cytochrome b subunit
MNLTRKTQNFLKDNFTLEDALPTRMPVYVNSMAYLFGVTALSGFILICTTGVIMAIFGPAWYHSSSVGHFVNSLHFWSVQVFFGGIILHAFSKFLMAAWRDGRWKTWAVGVLTFGLAVFTGLLGFLSQTNWDSQWIAVQAKDAMNSLGVGAFFNTMDTSQVLTMHVVLLPLLVLGFIGLHLFLIRRESPVKPIPVGENEENQDE